MKRIYKKRVFRKKILLFTIVLIIFLLIPIKTFAALSYTRLGSVVDSETMEGSWFGLGTKSGDVNGDGYSDLIVPAIQYDNTRGRLYVFFGGETLNITANIIISGKAEGDAFPGMTDTIDIAVADLDNDGYDDIIAGSGGNEDNGTNAGVGYIFWGSSSFSGRMSADTADIKFPGNPTTKEFLGSASAVGDFNGDGYLDILFSAPLANSNSGAVYLYLGNGTKNFDTTDDKSFSVSGSLLLGFVHLKSGDVNGDGYDDFLVEEMYSNQGEVYLFYGGADMDTTYDVKFYAEDNSDYLTRGSSAIKDLNNDGFDDICLGASMNDTASSNAGRVYCFFGSASFSGNKAVAIDANFIISGANTRDNFGRDMFVYDVNNDGNFDLIVSAYQISGSDDGYVNIYLGNGTGNFDIIEDVSITAGNIGESGRKFGNWVNAGDLDNDGWSDLFVTSAMGGNGIGDTGRVHIFEVDHGSPSVTPNDIGTTDDPTPTITGVARDPDVPLAGVQWSFGSDPSGEWYDCEASDGSFDSDEEEFLCDTALAGGELEGEYTIYIRTFDENGLYMPPVLFGTSTFTVELLDTEVELQETGSEVLIWMFVGVLFIIFLLYTRNIIEAKQRSS
ncbi:FG-GAP repeat domain-containing protein [Patescibacteria group bacterium]